ncbi:MAG TPA: protein-L-isoaspartate O-methyltransferase [Rhizomicrobium sp.]|nr:protein-L-isoaspartate O-methyltransferase [Rhizomicrobium sp.]
MPDYVVQRLNMVDSQVLANGVTDERLIEAFRNVPRERFVPSARRPVAYADAEIEIVRGRSLLAPRTFAKLLQFAEIQPSDSVLDVGCATGYSTAVLARISRRVIGLEYDADLVRIAVEALHECGARNASVVQGPLPDGYRGGAPFDVIIVEGGFQRSPEHLIAQLAEGGRLVGILQDEEHGRAILYLKEPGRVGRRIGFDASAPVLSGFRQPAGFVF